MIELNQFVATFVRDTRLSLWPPFAPELILCATILLLLIVRAISWGKRWDVSYLLAFAGSAAALAFAAYPTSQGVMQPPTDIFTGMLAYDSFTALFRVLLLVFTLLFILFTRLSGVPIRNDAADFLCLVLGGILGMCLMVSANHLLMVFLAVEMASIPSYVMAGLLKTRRSSSEAALKYSIYGAGAAGVMLYGISLLAGVLNTVHLPTMALRLSEGPFSGSELTVLALGGLMLMVGLAFKLSAVPFHFWCPDVFEGGPAEVGAFLSIASKGAAMALLIRICIGLGGPSPRVSIVDLDAEKSATVAGDDRARPAGFFAVADEPVNRSAAPAHGVDENHALSGTDTLRSARRFMLMVVGGLAAVTCTFGNLAAYGQTNIKRLMAYSTIAHAGYMMMAVPAALALMPLEHESAARAVASVPLYLGIYLFMNLGAFATIAFLRNSLQSEQIADYAGLVRRAPVLVICFAAILFSLVGLPPLAGFIGKFAIFAALVEGYQSGDSAVSTVLMGLLLIGGLNTAISLFYYLRVVKVMTIDPESATNSPRPITILPFLPSCYVLLVTVPVIALFVAWSPLHEWAYRAAEQLF